MKTAECPA